MWPKEVKISLINIFKADIKTGKETQVTFFEHGHVDGPEYSPGGKYIYYNGSQSGTMQIWRMKPDGSEKEQLTFGEKNNWFPHISPDGKWMVYITFPTTVAPGDHPSYKRVTLNLMPLGRRCFKSSCLFVWRPGYHQCAVLVTG
jgi:TolB protein